MINWQQTIKLTDVMAGWLQINQFSILNSIQQSNQTKLKTFSLFVDLLELEWNENRLNEAMKPAARIALSTKNIHTSINHVYTIA